MKKQLYVVFVLMVSFATVKGQEVKGRAPVLNNTVSLPAMPSSRLPAGGQVVPRSYPVPASGLSRMSPLVMTIPATVTPGSKREPKEEGKKAN